MKKYLSICFLLLLAYSAWLAREALVILAYVVGSVSVVGLILFILIAVWYAMEKMLMMKADRIERQKQSETMLINTSDGTWIRDTNRKASIQALHLQQAVYSDNRVVTSTEDEIRAWQVFNGPKSVAASKTPLLPESVSDSPLPLEPIMRRLEASHQILISGQTGSGKTTLCQHLLTWLASQGYSIMPCDIHSPGKMMGYDVIGSGRKFQDIFNALEVAVETMNKRYNHPSYGQADYKPQPIAIFIDELTTLVEESKGMDFNFSKVLQTLLTEGRKVSIKLILSIHSLDVKTLGLTAGIRESNTMVQLLGGEGSPYECYVVPPLANIRHKKDWQEHSLPGAFAGYPDIKDIVTKLPDVRNMKIKSLAQQGFSPTAIARNIFNTSKATGRQIKEISDVLSIS